MKCGTGKSGFEGDCQQKRGENPNAWPIFREQADAWRFKTFTEQAVNSHPAVNQAIRAKRCHLHLNSLVAFHTIGRRMSFSQDIPFQFVQAR